MRGVDRVLFYASIVRLAIVAHLGSWTLAADRCSEVLRDHPLRRLCPKTQSFPKVQPEYFRAQLETLYRTDESLLVLYDQPPMSCVGFAAASYISMILALASDGHVVRVSAADLMSRTIQVATQVSRLRHRSLSLDLAAALLAVKGFDLHDEDSFPSRNDINVPYLLSMIEAWLATTPVNLIREATKVDQLIENYFHMLRPGRPLQSIDLRRLPSQKLFTVDRYSSRDLLMMIKQRRRPTLISFRSEAISVDGHGLIGRSKNIATKKKGHAAVVIGHHRNSKGQLIFELLNSHANAPFLFISATDLETLLISVVADDSTS